MHDLLAGLVHPLHGGDHLLAMLAVGVLAARFEDRARWILPLIFPGFMLLGLAALPSPGPEPMIPASVVALGLATAAAVRLPLALLAALAALFALFHGHAHLEEMLPGASLGEFAAGMLAATGTLHAAGIALGIGLARIRAWLPRALGGAISLAGGYLLAG
jgi:urease accessory protein